MVQAAGISSTFGRADNGNASANNSKKMEKTLKVWHAVATLIGLTITVGSILISVSNKIETQRLRIEFLEKMSIRNEDKFDKIQDQLTQIRLMLENKEDRSKK